MSFHTRSRARAHAHTHTHKHTYTVYAEQLQVWHDCWFCICGVGRIFDGSSSRRSICYCTIYNLLYNNSFCFSVSFIFNVPLNFSEQREFLVPLFLFLFKMCQYFCRIALFFCYSFITAAPYVAHACCYPQRNITLIQQPILSPYSSTLPGGWSPASHRGGSGTIPFWSVWDL